ncbi:MAG: hypothetical protein ROY99_14630 [Ignavibacterium sp.]|nr:hypothetical protein [Ignavibacterium sp.]
MRIFIRKRGENDVVTVIKKKTGKEKIKELLTAIGGKEKLLITSRYSGKLKLKKSPLVIQKKLRNERN